MISIVLCASKSKQDFADVTIPLWLKQKGVDFEIVISTDKFLKLPDDKRIRRVPISYTEELKFCLIKSMNTCFKEAKGDILLITQIDMEPNSDHLLLNMLRKLERGHMVSERFFKNDRRHSGLFCQLLMVWKSDVEKAGGFYEGYCGLISFEDNDLMCTLLDNGVLLDFICFDKEYATHHLWHPTNYEDPKILDLITKARAVFESRHKRTLLLTYARQHISRKKPHNFTEE